jgi:PilZ domain
MSEHRRAVRQRRFAAGKIEFGRAGVVGCMIRNLSSTGALLEIGAPTNLPDKFRLVVLSNIKQRNCEVVWRHGNRFGVVFTGPEYFGSNMTDPARQASVRAAIAASVARWVEHSPLIEIETEGAAMVMPYRGTVRS